MFSGDDFVALVHGTGDAHTFRASDIVDQVGLFSRLDSGVSWSVCGSIMITATIARRLLILRKEERRTAYAPAGKQWRERAGGCKGG
eukprot:2815272-Prymnesium_polylepis.1